MQMGLEAAQAAAKTLTNVSTGNALPALNAGPVAENPQPFSALLTDAVGQVNTLEAQAHDTVTGLMTGSGVDVHQAMIATQKASAAFELTLAVRNKAVAAYQTMMGMQF